jgi:hypothetical protein
LPDPALPITASTSDLPSAMGVIVPPVDIHAEAPQALGDAVMGFGLFVGEDGRGRSHGPDPSRPRADARGAVDRGGTIKSLDHPTPCLGSACPSR